jgi:hypothetical protein
MRKAKTTQTPKPLDLTFGVEAQTPKLRVYWIPQVGADMPLFEVLISSLTHAKILLDTLAKYDLFQLEYNIKPDFSNAGGVDVFENGDWCDYDASDLRYDCQDKMGLDVDFDKLTLAQCATLDIFSLDRSKNV